MKNKRKIINKYLSQFEAIDSGTIVSYWDSNAHGIKVIWYKKKDEYLTGPPNMKSFTLKQYCKHAIRMLDIKVFW